MNQTSFAQSLALSATLPRLNQTEDSPVAIGIFAPLSGPAEQWGRPGLQGCEIWADWVNAAGGLRVGQRRRRVVLKAWDCAEQNDVSHLMRGVRWLVDEAQVSLILTLGGADLQAVQSFLTERKVLTSTLLPSDLSPDTPYLIAPSEVHPVYAVTGVQHICQQGGAKSAALCAQNDAMGLPSLATYRAAFQAEGCAIADCVTYAAEGGDAKAIVARMMAQDPDVLCWCTSYPPMVAALTRAAFEAGFEGQILSCTADGYDQMIADTSQEFMEGFTFQFPDFDDPALAEKAFFFNQPKVFFTEYNARFPGGWSAVSWEYAAILDLWQAAVERAESVSSVSVLAAMKQGGEAAHAFGKARWWGTDLFGVDNALVGDWPIVEIRSGKARIVGFRSVPAWLESHEAALKSEMESLGQLWDQRLHTSETTGP